MLFWTSLDLCLPLPLFMLIEGVYGLLLEMNLAWTCDTALDFKDELWYPLPNVVISHMGRAQQVTHGTLGTAGIPKVGMSRMCWLSESHHVPPFRAAAVLLRINRSHTWVRVAQSQRCLWDCKQELCVGQAQQAQNVPEVTLPRPTEGTKCFCQPRSHKLSQAQPDSLVRFSRTPGPLCWAAPQPAPFHGVIPVQVQDLMFVSV